MDLVSVTTSPASSNSRTAAPRRLFSFLSVAWGFVSDVDIESERLVCVHLNITPMQLYYALSIIKDSST